MVDNFRPQEPQRSHYLRRVTDSTYTQQPEALRLGRLEIMGPIMGVMCSAGAMLFKHYVDVKVESVIISIVAQKDEKVKVRRKRNKWVGNSLVQGTKPL